MSVWIIVGVAGCGAAVQFNRTYLPAAVPDRPAARIVFEGPEGRRIAAYARQTRIANFFDLQWLEEKGIYLNLEGDSLLVIDPVQLRVHEASDVEAVAVKQQLAQKVVVSLDQEGMGFFAEMTARFLSYSGLRFVGELRDNGHTIGVEIITDQKREEPDHVACKSMQLKGKLTSPHHGVTDVAWDFNCEWMPPAITALKVPQLLRRLRVSPSEKYYLYGSILYRVENNETVGDLLGGYPGVIAVSVNPAWTAIALLRHQDNFFCLEIFPVEFDESGHLYVRKSDR